MRSPRKRFAPGSIDNVLINNDGYYVRTGDFCLYLDEERRFHVIPRDANETFRGMSGPGLGGMQGGSGVELDPLFGIDDPMRPLVSRLLAVPSLQARYLAHVRTLADEWLDWKKLGPLVTKLQDLIADEVTFDTRKLEPSELFREGTAGESGENVRRRPGSRGLSLRSFVEARRKYLSEHIELKKPAPRIASVSPQVPRDGPAALEDPAAKSVLVTAEVAGEVQPGEVLLYYAPGRCRPFTHLAMEPGEARRYTASIPPLPTGAVVRYYVEARSAEQGTSSYFPAGAESGALEYKAR